KKPGKPAAPPSDQPDPKSQRNFTDPESRIMKSKDGFVQAYNAQAAVDAGAQIIVAHELTQCGNDQGQLVPLIEAIESISAVNRSRPQRTPATAAKPISQRSKHTVSTAMSRPGAPSTRQPRTEKSADL